LAPPHILEEARSRWLEAFERCSQHTLRCLCCPLRRQDPGDGGLGTLLADHSSVTSVLTSGVSLAKSPSQQRLDHLEDEYIDPEAQERGERSWWSDQYHKVMHEVERGATRFALGDSNLGMTVQPRRQRAESAKRSSTAGGPRPLLLGSRLSTSPVVDERKGLFRSLSRKSK